MELESLKKATRNVKMIHPALRVSLVFINLQNENVSLHGIMWRWMQIKVYPTIWNKNIVLQLGA